MFHTLPLFGAASRPAVSFNAINETLVLPGVANGYQTVVTGDFNGDGRPDFAILSGLSNSGVFVVLGKGNGTFEPGVLYPLLTGDGAPVAMAVGDFNGDGKTDLVLTTAVDGFPQSIAVLLGRGNGTFGAPIISAGGGVAIAVGDFNNDGKLDVVTASGPNGTSTGFISVWLGNGNGTFEKPRQLYPAGAYNLATVAVGDFNGDGKLDIVEGDEFALRLLQGNGDGTFQPAADIGDGSYYAFLTVLDLNRDGKSDIVASDAEGVSVLLGNGDGTFQAPIIATAAVAGAIAGGDFNGDGKPDLAVADNTEVLVLLGNGDGTFQAPLIDTLGDGITSLAVSDFNIDGRQDVVIASGAASTFAVLLGHGDGTFPGVPPSFGPTLGAVVESDFNGDGYDDLAILDPQGNLWVLSGNGNGAFQPAVQIATGFSGNVPSAPMAAADFDHNGTPDLAVVSGSPESVRVFLGKGDGTFREASQAPVNGRPFLIRAGHFNGGAIEDLAVGIVRSNGTYGIEILLGNGKGTFQNRGTLTVADLSDFAVADFNGDGKQDLAVAGYDSHTILIYLGEGNGTFSAPIQVPIPTAFNPTLAAADFNNDGKWDLAFTTGFNVSVLLGNGDGTFQAPVSSGEAGIWPAALAAADFNGDGNQDVAVVVVGGVSVMLGNGDGTLQPPVMFDVYAGGSFGELTLEKGQVIAVGQFNGDHKVDIVTPSGYFSGAVLLQNRTQ